MLYAIYGAAGIIVGIFIMIIILLIASKTAGRKRVRNTSSTTPERKKLEFPQFIVGLYAFACIAWIEQDYILALMYQKPINTEVTITLTTTLAATIIGAFIKSSFEKANRNKHHIDENGKPFNIKG